MATPQRDRWLGWTLIGLSPVLLLLALGLAFTYFSYLTAVLALASLVAGTIRLAGSGRPVAPTATSLEDEWERRRIDDSGK